ncbi:relaxase/mobilization nuclease domain-containing protein [Paracoccus yeei]|uniref:relaxase/mobilization nuclease domain-containing protein n=1 Tax=Paracoccus yeei TaxID=147645 RepID=UPI003BF82E78
MVEHDPDRRSLTPEQRKAIARDWEDGWTRDPKNGHTTHLLLSFPADVAPARALKVAEIWAAETFQGGIADDEWAYVAALHTDRAHPHVHIVVNNRGVANDSWFYMARGHAFEIQGMKERIVEIAAEEGLFLDSSSRIQRGKLTYGPSRAELERALREGCAVRERPLQGKAVHEAMTQIAANIVTLRLFSSMARQLRDSALAAKIAHAAEVLSRGGIVEPLQEEPMEAQAIQTRGDLAAYYDRWLDNAERGINRLPEAERADLRRALYEAAASVSRELGDDRGAALLRQEPRESIHRTQLQDQAIARGAETRALGSDAVAEIRDRIGQDASALGIDPAALGERMRHGAANAWQERVWTRQDIEAVAAARRLDLETEAGRNQVAGLVDGFYGRAAELLDRTLQRGARNDRVVRTLGAMSESLRETGVVAFQNNDHAARFARDLKERYGDDLMARLARGDDRALALDIADPAERRATAHAVVAAAERHEGMGMTLSQVDEAKTRLSERDEGDTERSRDRE